MNGVAIERWAAWAPGLEERPAWERWSRQPVGLAAEGRPDARFLPALLRRRCSPLARIMLTAAHACCEPEEIGAVRSVFASRHGNINESIDLLYDLADGRPLSPARFSHTVHNAQAGLFSIAAGNRRASSSIAALADTFGCGFLEALAHLEREPARPVLLVTGDVPLAETFSALVTEPPAAYAVALLLRVARRGTRVALDLAEAEPRAHPLAWPEAPEFLRWWLCGEPRLALGTGRSRFAFERLD